MPDKVHLRGQGDKAWCSAGRGYSIGYFNGELTSVPEECTCNDCLVKAVEFGERANRRWKKINGDS